MKKYLVLVLVAMFVMAGVAMADEATENTVWQTTGGSGLNSWLNENAQHEHSIDSSNPIGLGIDVDYDWSETFATGVELRRDFENDVTSAYLVGRINLNSLIK